MSECPEDYTTHRNEYKCSKTTARDRAAKGLSWTSYSFSVM